MKNYQKGFAPIIALIIIVVVLVGGYIFYRQSSQSSSTNVTTNVFEGKWTRLNSTTSNTSEITINNATASQFSFKLNSKKGTSVAEMSGNALIQGNTATYTIPDGSGIKCSITFSIKDSTLSVVPTKDCTRYAASGVTFDGEYAKSAQTQ
jgi:hypothetical protein